MKTDSKKIKDPQSFLEELKNDWSLFWHAFTGDVPVVEEDFSNDKLEPLSLEKIKELTKSLSQNRKKLNQKLEKINKEIEESTAHLETLNLVGGPVQDTLDKISELNDLGQQTNHQLTELNEKIKKARRLENQIKKLKEI